MRKALWIDLIAGLLILLFIYTAFSKLLAFEVYKTVLHKSPMIGRMAPAIASGLPLTEIVIAGLLFFPATKSIGLYSSLIALSLFTIYIIYMLLFAPYLPCSCGGVLKQMSWRQHLLFNFFFIAVTVWGIWLNKRRVRGWSEVVPYPTREDVL